MKSKTYQKILTPILSAALIASLTPTLAFAAPAALEAAQIEGVATENAPDNAKGESVDVEGVSEQGFSEQGSNSKYGAYIKNPAAKMSKKSLNMVKAFKKRFVTKEFKFSKYAALKSYILHYRKDFTGGFSPAAQKTLFNEFQLAQIKPKGWDNSKKKIDLSKLDTTCSSNADLLITWESGKYGHITEVHDAVGVDLIDTSKINEDYQNTRKDQIRKMPFVTRAVYNDEISKVVRVNPLQRAAFLYKSEYGWGGNGNDGRSELRSVDANELGLYDSLAGSYYIKAFSPNRLNTSKLKNFSSYDSWTLNGLWGEEFDASNEFTIKSTDPDYRYGCIRWGYSYTDKAGKEHKGVWELYEGVDYVIKDHGKNKYIPGKYKIEIIGKGRFTGKIEFTYNVGKLDLGYDMKQSSYGSSASLLLGYFGNSNTVGISNAQAETALKKDLKKKNIKSLNGIVWKQFGEHDYRLVLTKTAKMHLKKSLYFKCLQNEDKSKPYAKKLKTKIKIKKLFIPSRYKKYVSYNKKADVLILKKGVINPFGALAKIKIEVSSPYISGDLFKNKKTYTTEYGWYIWMGRAWDCDTYELSFTNKNRVINY